MTNRSLNKILTGSVYLIFVLFFIMVFTVGPRIEVLLNPVIGSFQITRSWSEVHENGKRRYFIRGAMLKIRGECAPVELVMVANGGISDENSKFIKINFDSDPVSSDHMVTRPSGAQHWGPWEIIPPSEPIGPIVSLFVTHRCHSLWQQTQMIFSGSTTKFFPDLNIDKAR